MRVLFLLTKRQPPSTRLRIVNCLDSYRAAGIECTAIPIPSGLLGRMDIFRQARRHDVVVIQKKTSFHAIELAMLRRANPRIVFDFDDAVMFHELEHGKPLAGKHFRKFARTVSHCAAVVAGNSFLAMFARPNCPNTHVLPTPIDAGRYRVKAADNDDGAFTIGWIGVGGNLPYLQRIAPVFQRLARNYPGIRVKIVSNDFIDIDGVDVDKEKWSLEGEVEALRSFDVGVMPLDDTLWARGKCGFKILQYMGVGVPAIASPVGINSELIEPGKTGYLATSEDEWYEALARLCEDASLRRSMGEAGRQRLERLYSQEIYVRRYADILRAVARGEAHV